MAKKKKLERLAYRQVTGLSVNAFGRKGKLIGETERQTLPKVGKTKTDWKRKEYYTYFDVRDREHGIGRIQFQRHKRSGLFNLNFQKVGFNSTVILDDRMMKKIHAFVWAYAHAQATQGHMPIIDSVLVADFQKGFKVARKQYLRRKPKH